MWGPDPDQLPAWCREYRLDDLIRVESNQLQFKQGQGVMSTLSYHDWTSIPTGQVADGDFIYVRGIYLEVKAFATDFNSVMYNVVGFTKNVHKNINKQKFSIGKMRVVQGRIVDIERQFVLFEKAVSMVLSKIDENDIGTLVISFRNASFNSLGFLTHDTAI